MWHWERGRLRYFQFDVLRRIAVFATKRDWKTTTYVDAEAAIGLPFAPQSSDYPPWRNYARLFRLMLLVTESGGQAQSTSLAAALAIPGRMTSDEYFHSLAQSHSDPSLASDWTTKPTPRFPFLFVLKYLLARAATAPAETNIDELIGAYIRSGFVGNEDHEEFTGLLNRKDEFEDVARNLTSDQKRNARESIFVLCQISYLSARRAVISVNLHREDAVRGFHDLKPIVGPFLADADAEARRRADLYADGSALEFLNFESTVLGDLREAGFAEGSRVKRTHLVIERNSGVRRLFMNKFNPQTCDVCRLQTAKSYPWTQGVIDVHHKLPLASGTRSSATQGTVLDDLVAVCPSCHRAVHRYYDKWLKARNRDDFETNDEALLAYESLKSEFPGAVHAT